MFQENILSIQSILVEITVKMVLNSSLTTYRELTIDAVTNYLILSGLKQYRFTIFHQTQVSAG